MKKFMVAAALAALATTPALAKVKSPPPPPPAPASNWAGCYVGVNGGIGWNKGNTHYNDPNTTTDPINFIPNVVPSSFIPAPSGTGGTGGLGGGGAGCNWQNQQWVYGLEGDIDGGRIAGSQTNSVIAATATVFGINPVAGLSGLLGNPTGTASESTQLNWLSTIRGRIGLIVQDRLLLFATGGLALGGVSSQGSVNVANSVVQSRGPDRTPRSTPASRSAVAPNGHLAIDGPQRPSISGTISAM